MADTNVSEWRSNESCYRIQGNQLLAFSLLQMQTYIYDCIFFVNYMQEYIYKNKIGYIILLKG